MRESKSNIISSVQPILLSDQIAKLKQLLENKKIVLVGGCFDILHPGHIYFLQQAKKLGKVLCVFLEADQRIQAKGRNKPVHTQKERAQILSALKAVDYVILLKFSPEPNYYDQLVQELKPSIIATTQKNHNVQYLRRCAKLTESRIVELPFLKKHSTTNIIKKLLPET